MRVLDPGLDLERFFGRVRRARERVLLVDYDGTLAPFHPRPERAAPYPRVAPLLNDIGRRTRTRVVMVSGRTLEDLAGPLSHIRSHDVWGAHGWQRRRPGRAASDFRPSARQLELLDKAERKARTLEPLGARVERKPASLAVHWRGLDRLTADMVRERLQRAWGRLERDGLECLGFDGGEELRASGRTKGSAVRQVLKESSPGAVCAYLGDDRTDEDAFEAVRPRGLGVLVRPVLRPTRAGLWLEPPRELVAFLERWRRSAGAR